MKRLVKIFVTFDCFGTLYIPSPSVAKQYTDCVIQHTNIQSIPEELVAQQFKEAFVQVNKQRPNYGIGTNKYTKNDGNYSEFQPKQRPFVELSLDEQEREMKVIKNWWMEVIRLTFKEFNQQNCKTQISSNSSKTNSIIPQQAFEDIYHRFGDKKAYAMYPDVVPMLDRLEKLRHELNSKSCLNQKEIKISSADATESNHSESSTAISGTRYQLNWGLLTNSDPQVFGVLQSFDILERLGNPAHMFLSFDMGVQKPDYRVFEYVMQRVKNDDNKCKEMDLVLDEFGSTVKIKPTDIGQPNSTKDTDSIIEYVFFHVGDEVKNDQLAASSVAGWNGVLIDRKKPTGNDDIIQHSNCNEKNNMFTITSLEQLEQLIKRYINDD